MNHTVKELAQEHSILEKKKQEIKKKSKQHHLFPLCAGNQLRQNQKNGTFVHRSKDQKHREMEISFSETSTNSSDHCGDNQSRHARPTVLQEQVDDSSEYVSKDLCHNEQNAGETDENCQILWNVSENKPLESSCNHGDAHVNQILLP